MPYLGIFTMGLEHVEAAKWFKKLLKIKIQKIILGWNQCPIALNYDEGLGVND